jgi:CRP-like cAMP-binding protein
MNQLAIQTAWEGPPQCEECGIRDLVLFSRLERDDFALIHEPIDEIPFGKEEMPYRAGDASDHVFTIREGVIKLVHYSKRGTERIVRLLKRGDVAGLEALLGQSYHHHAVVLDPALTCRIPVSVVNHLSRELPRFHYELLTRWQHAVDEADTWLTELGTGPVKARVARLLLRLADGELSNGCFMPTREDMGAMLGVTTESVSRITAEFKRAGLIDYVAPSRVRIHSEALQQLAG